MKPILALMRVLSLTLGVLPGVSAARGSRSGFDLSSSMNGFSFKQAPKICEPSIDITTSKFSRLRHIKGSAGRRSAISAVNRASRRALKTADEKFQNVSAAGHVSTQYAIQCSWDSTPVWLLFDTGSSDTWATRSDFECLDNAGEVHGQGACGLAMPYVDSFGQGSIDDLHFLLKYGSGEEVSGPMGYSDIACGGLSVSKQQVGLANHTYWHGNNITNGILGLAYSSITSAYYGEIGDEAPWNSVSYPPFFTTAIAQGTIDPVFSVAIRKNSSDGVLAWGGVPPIAYDKSTYASTDLIIANLVDEDETAWSYSFYTIIPDGVKWGTTTDEAKYPYIVDTGTTMLYLPPPLAEAISKAFEPEAVYLYQWDAYFVDCNAMPPRFAILIEGVEFWVNPADLIYKELIDPMTGYCAIGIASGGAGPYILGDVFLQNVLAVFDVGGAQMRFYSRK